uniref:Pentacotripeptide-repeat region of PRORP domain-containing protein n=1 Tax=Pseudo-nitzschia australis TaxID=44445 RepID=A0A7S4EP10_9STRA|mmetsp:Transcript_18999/g.39943  ORF Transcript_18999/g.39943 Transcript_18999/m.39943 type:complete len:975 (+) Transcript_18999:119-3043(+)
MILRMSPLPSSPNVQFKTARMEKRRRRWRGLFFVCILFLFISRISPSCSFIQNQPKSFRKPPMLSAKRGGNPSSASKSQPKQKIKSKTETATRSHSPASQPQPKQKNKSKTEIRSIESQNKRPNQQNSKFHRDNTNNYRKQVRKRKNLSAEAVKFNQELSGILSEKSSSGRQSQSRRTSRHHVPPIKILEYAENLLLERVEASTSNDDYDTFSFNLILSGWARQRSLEGAQRADKLFQFLLRTSDDNKNIVADSYSYSSVLNAYAKSGGKQKAALRAEELLQQMEFTMKITTDICHNAVMDCWSLSGDDDAGRRAHVLLTKLEENKIRNRKSRRNINATTSSSLLPEPTRISYNICLKAWARSTDGATHAHALLTRMQQNDEEDLHPDKISFSTCIDAYCRSTGTTNLTMAAELAEGLLYQMEQASPKNPSIRPDVVSYTSVLYSYAKAGVDIDRAMSLINRMKEHAGEGPNTTFLNTLIHLFAKQGKADHAEALLKSMKQNDLADKISYTSVIAAHANVGNATRALALFHELEGLYKSSLESSTSASSNNESSNARRFMPTEKTFTSLIHAISKSKAVSKTSLDEVDEIVKKMHSLYNETKNPELLPSTATYSTLFYLLSKMRDSRAPVRAMEMLEEMKRRQKQQGKLRPDATTYAYLINIFTKTRVREAAERATGYLRDVEEGYAAGDDNLRPTKLLYSAALQAYAKSASREGAELAEKLLQRTKDLYKQGKVYAKPTTLYYNAVMDGLARSRQGKAGVLRAESLLDELEARGRAGDPELSPTSRSYNAVILAWKMSNCTEAPQRAEAILKRMNERYRSGDKGCRPDQVTINSIIGVWANSRQEGAAERAETYLKFMEELYYEAEDESLKPDSISYNSVIDAYAWCSSGEGAHRAEEVYNRMQQKFLASGDDELRPNIITLTTLTNAWSRSGDEKAEFKLKNLRYMISERRKLDREERDMASTLNVSGKRSN